MENICDRTKCTACGACAGVCPMNCISFVADEKESGHIHPQIEQGACIDCGQCVRTCPVNTRVELSQPWNALAAYVKDTNVCNRSSSGGAAFVLAAEIINRGGVVYGSIIKYGSDFSIRHERLNSLESLKTAQGSKYVQSEIARNIYNDVKTDLQEGREVLFTGTGCQIAGLKNYLKIPYASLYTIDIVCHGVPSQKLLKDALNLRFDISQIKQLQFRNKSQFGFSGLYGSNATKFNVPLKDNLYMMGFMKGLYYRSVCYQCLYAQSRRCSDITLGDFWGLKQTFVDRPHDSKGISLVLINSEKGERLFNAVKSSLSVLQRSISEAVDGNPQLRNPSSKHYAYDVFKNLLPCVGFKWAARMTLLREKIFYSWVLPFISKK